MNERLECVLFVAEPDWAVSDVDFERDGELYGAGHLLRKPGYGTCKRIDRLPVEQLNTELTVPSIIYQTTQAQT